ncbi:MAG: bifunctional folylpolyglutamate synthase/dihydrofolate synthase [Clostridiales bacterium]|jgi:dihydrofolate synthase/folylpolyglutamate synthase|nr:bifunctional folylpolyglutamate synthase/dihydrofolate synthase [Clostridiales bacterium]
MTYSYQQAQGYLTAARGSRSGDALSDAKELLEKLGNPQEGLRVIHIAGTNGKGSVSAMLGAVLNAAGYKAGMFTSPHLERINERISVDGKSVSDEDFAEAFSRVVSVSENAGRGRASFFTILTVMAFDWFARCKVDFAIMETGIGGRLDSTNAVNKPALTVITSIGYDHTEILGLTLENIAFEKAGIIKRGCPLVLGSASGLPVINRQALRLGAKTYRAGDKLRVTGKEYTGGFRQAFSIQTEYFSYNKLILALLGEYQLDNAATALTAVRALRDAGYDIGEKPVREGLANVRWPGRFEVIPGAPLIVFDGAHNEDGAAFLRKSLNVYYPDKKVIPVVGTLRNKDSQKIVGSITRNAETVVCTEPPHANALPARELASLLQNPKKVYVYPNPVEALSAATEAAGADGVAAVAGSLYLVGELRRIIHDRLQRGN